MAKDFPKLEPKHIDFIKAQKIFFTSTATADSHINTSPRSTDYLRVIDDHSVVYLDRTGSGNETAAHVMADGRMTIMLCAFEGAPNILRLFGKGEIIHRNSAEFKEIAARYFDNELPMGVRQFVRLAFHLVKTSCGYGVPFFDYKDERDGIDKWEANKGESGIADYWDEKNQTSMDGLPTGIFDTPE